MITNERQYRITRSELRHFEDAISTLLAQGIDQDTDDALFRRLQVDAMRSQLDDLRAEVAEYESIKAGERPLLRLDSFDQLPEALVAARIAAGLTQRDLAERLGVHVQQIQRYEAARYRSASVKRVNEVVRALGIEVRIAVALPTRGAPEPA